MIKRALNRETWTLIDNMPVRDPHLSFECLGALIYLLSFSDNWKPLISDVMRRGGIGRNKAQRIFRELKKAGYLEEHIRRAPNGVIIAHEYIVYEEPFDPQTRKANFRVLKFPNRKEVAVNVH